MTRASHLWALGFDAVERAEQVRAEITRLGAQGCLVLLHTAVAARYADGCTTLDGERLVATPKLGGHTLASFLAGLALGAPPLTGAVACAYAKVGIGADFIDEVAALLRPGTSALFVLDREGDLPAILQGIRGLGGTVLKTNVDLERARLIQATLAAQAEDQP
jgi:uncharacterized membrane protein